MSELSDYDIIEIDDRGIYYQLYSRKEDEAGVVTTPRCNSNCVMCPASESSRQGCSDTPVDRLLQYVRYLPIEDTQYAFSDETPPDCLRSFTFTIKRWRNHPENDMIRVSQNADNPIGKKFTVHVYTVWEGRNVLSDILIIRYFGDILCESLSKRVYLFNM